MDFSIFPVPVIFIVTVISAIIMGTLNGDFAKKNDGGIKKLVFRNSIYVFVTALVLYALSGFAIKLSMFSFIMALAFGLVVTSYSFTSLQAYKFGPYGYTLVIVCLSTVLTSLSGFLFWNEPFSAYKIVGITLMVFCFIFAVENKKDDHKKANLKWFLLCLASMLLSASTGLLQKVHQKSQYKGELMGFLVVAFLFSTLLYSIIYLCLRKKGDRIVPISGKKELLNFLLPTICVGVLYALQNCLNLYLSGVVDSALMFPIVNGVPLMGGIIVSFVLFKERLSKKQLVGLCIGVIAIVFLCI